MSSDYFNYSSDLQRILRGEGVTLSDGRHIREFAGASTVNNLIVIREVMLRHKPRKTMEIGLAHGVSALSILSTLHEQHPGGDFQHTAIDPFQSGPMNGIGRLLIKDRPELEAHFQFFENFSDRALPQMLDAGQTVDFAYIDGSHLFEDVIIDMYLTAQLMEVGGIMLFDDSRDPHVRKVFKFMRTNFTEVLEPLDLEPYRSPIQSSPLKKWARRMGYRQLEGFRKHTDVRRRKWDTPLRNF